MNELNRMTPEEEKRKANWMRDYWRREARRERIGRILFWAVVVLTIAAPAFGCGWLAGQHAAYRALIKADYTTDRQ